jgi:hypothetical protein
MGEAGRDIENGTNATEGRSEEQQLGNADLNNGYCMLVVTLGAMYIARQARHMCAERREPEFECKFLAGRVGLYGRECSESVDGCSDGL